LLQRHIAGLKNSKKQGADLSASLAELQDEVKMADATDYDQ
jgi:hypothetical protein